LEISTALDNTTISQQKTIEPIPKKDPHKKKKKIASLSISQGMEGGE